VRHFDHGRIPGGSFAQAQGSIAATTTHLAAFVVTATSQETSSFPGVNF
jgi:hypothetical protein